MVHRPVLVDCRKPGYEPAQAVNVSGTSGAAVARGLLVGGNAGCAGGSIRGSDDQYDDATHLTRRPAMVAAAPIVRTVPESVAAKAP
jgi:hypothetical protein